MEGNLRDSGQNYKEDEITTLPCAEDNGNSKDNSQKYEARSSTRTDAGEADTPLKNNQVMHMPEFKERPKKKVKSCK